MDGKKEDEPEKSLTLRYLLENPALLQPPEDGEEGSFFFYKFEESAYGIIRGCP